MDAATLRVADVEHKSADQRTCESELEGLAYDTIFLLAGQNPTHAFVREAI